MVSRRPGESAPTGASPGCRSRHDRQRLAGRPRSRLAAGMNDHVAKPIDKERLVLCLLGHLGRSGAGRAGNGSGRGRTGRGAGDIVGRFGGSLELIVQVLRRFVPDMQDLFAQLERQLGEGDVQAAPRPCIPSRAALPPLAPAPGRPCQRAGAGPAPRRCCAAWKSSPASASTNCAPCAMPACSACRRCSATCRRSRRAEPRRGGQSRQGFRRTRGSPASAAACRANNAWALSADTPEARPGLERHPFPVVQCLQASRSRSWALSRA